MDARSKIYGGVGCDSGEWSLQDCKKTLDKDLILVCSKIGM